MALLAGAMCGVRNDSCSRKHKYARTSHGMASESLSRGVDLFFAQEFCFFKQEHGPPRGSKQAKTDVLLTTVLGPPRSAINLCEITEADAPLWCGRVPRWERAADPTRHTSGYRGLSRVSDVRNTSCIFFFSTSTAMSHCEQDT